MFADTQRVSVNSRGVWARGVPRHALPRVAREPARQRRGRRRPSPFILHSRVTSIVNICSCARAPRTCRRMGGFDLAPVCRRFLFKTFEPPPQTLWSESKSGEVWVIHLPDGTEDVYQHLSARSILTRIAAKEVEEGWRGGHVTHRTCKASRARGGRVEKSHPLKGTGWLQAWLGFAGTDSMENFSFLLSLLLLLLIITVWTAASCSCRTGTTERRVQVSTGSLMKASCFPQQNKSFVLVEFYCKIWSITSTLETNKHISHFYLFILLKKFLKLSQKVFFHKML